MALFTLRYVLANDAALDSGDFLYLPFEEKWNLDTRCAVLPESDADGTPAIAVNNGLEYALSISAVQDIVYNARHQIQNVRDEQLLHAFLFYYDNDAFVDFSAVQEGDN